MDKEDRNIRPDFKLSTDTLVLIERLREFGYGDNITYRQISEWIGRNVQTEARGILESALRYLAREEAFFFSTVRGSGIQRITESDCSRAVPAITRKRIRNESRRAIKRLHQIPDEKLSREEIKDKNANIALTGTIGEWAREKEAKKVIEAAPDDGRLSTGNIIDLLRKKAG